MIDPIPNSPVSSMNSPVAPGLNQPASTVSTSTTTSTTTTSSASNMSPKPKRRMNWKVLFGSLVVLVLMLGAGVGFYLSQQQQDIRQQASNAIDNGSVPGGCVAYGDYGSCDLRPGTNVYQQCRPTRCTANPNANPPVTCAGVTCGNSCRSCTGPEPIETSNPDPNVTHGNNCRSAGGTPFGGSLGGPIQCNATQGAVDVAQGGDITCRYCREKVNITAGATCTAEQGCICGNGADVGKTKAKNESCASTTQCYVQSDQCTTARDCREPGSLITDYTTQAACIEAFNQNGTDQYCFFKPASCSAGVCGNCRLGTDCFNTKLECTTAQVATGGRCYYPTRGCVLDTGTPAGQACPSGSYSSQQDCFSSGQVCFDFNDSCRAKPKLPASATAACASINPNWYSTQQSCFNAGTANRTVPLATCTAVCDLSNTSITSCTCPTGCVRTTVTNGQTCGVRGDTSTPTNPSTAMCKNDSSKPIAQYVKFTCPNGCTYASENGVSAWRCYGENGGRRQDSTTPLHLTGDECGQVDQLSVAGDDSSYCGYDPLDYNCNLERCHGTTSTPPATPPVTPPSTPTGPQCLSITMSIAQPKIGDQVTFTCGEVAGAASYQFRVVLPGGQEVNLAATGRTSAPFAVAQDGMHFAQCRICTSPDPDSCQQYESIRATR